MGRITIDQSHQVMAVLATNTDWEQIDFETAGLQDTIIRDPKGAGRRFTEFLKNSRFIKTSNDAKHIVNCDQDPKIPADRSYLKLDMHDPQGIIKLVNKDGNLYANKKKISLLNSEHMIPLHKVLQELSGKVCLNFCVLNHLLQNPKIIPYSWRPYHVYFLRTIFRDQSIGLCVPYLYKDDIRNEWNWCYSWICSNWDDRFNRAAYL